MNTYIQFSQIPGTGSGGPPNFSYYTIEVGETVEVPENQEMITTQDIMVRGDLIVRGLVTQLTDSVEESDTMWTRIPLNKTVVVPQDRVMFYKSPFLRVLGNLRVIGDLMEVA